MTNATERIIFILILFLFGGIMAHSLHARPEPDTALWLARSCVGEAGWKSYTTGECAAIAHVYKKRADRANRSYYRTMRRYSGAIKPHKNHTRPWLFQLARDGKRPTDWPKGADWNNYRDRWLKMVWYADKYVQGRVVDPLPTADHYCGWVDRHRIPARGWKRLNSPFRNWFFDVQGVD